MYVCVCVCVNECVELNHFAIYLKLTHCKLTMRALTVHAKSLQLCPTLCNPMDHSPLGVSVHGILQARILELVARPSSRISSQPRDGNGIS